MRVIRRAPQDSVSGARGEALVVPVTAPPVDSTASDALVDAAADFLGVSCRRLEITPGTGGRDKQVVIGRARKCFISEDRFASTRLLPIGTG